MSGQVSIEDFMRSLADTQRWCRAKMETTSWDLGNGFRSPELRPPVLDENKGHLRYAWETDALHAVAVESVVAQRQEFMRHTVTEAKEEFTVPGRLLAYDSNYNDWSGGPQSVTDGYFDVDEVPPWDTWVCFVGAQKDPFASFLISWVHPTLIDTVTAGIDASPCGSLAWVDEMDAPFTRALRQFGLVTYFDARRAQNP